MKACMPIANRANKDLLISLQDTNILKGIGLLLLLAHHLFYIQNGLYDDIHILGDHYLVEDIGKWSKLCVAIFVFLSGYGLTIGSIKTHVITNVRQFYWHRFTKLMLNYWFIWLVFVPIGVLVFNQSFTDAYQTMIIPKFILDLLGIINCFGWLGYNGTWWFYSCIIVLYFSFPWLYRLMEKSLWLLLVVIFALYFIPGPFFHGSNIYFACFTMGMLFCKYNDTIKINNPALWIIMFGLLAIERFMSKDVYLYDAILTFALVMAYKSIYLPTIVKKILDFLGKHSMNIFLFHTFIYYYWFQDLIYATRNPLVIYLSLLLICVIVSLLLEFIKKIIRFDNFVKHIDGIYGNRQ